MKTPKYYAFLSEQEKELFLIANSKEKKNLFSKSRKRFQLTAKYLNSDEYALRASYEDYINLKKEGKTSYFLGKLKMKLASKTFVDKNRETYNEYQKDYAKEKYHTDPVWRKKYEKNQRKFQTPIQKENTLKALKGIEKQKTIILIKRQKLDAKQAKLLVETKMLWFKEEALKKKLDLLNQILLQNVEEISS